MSEKYGEDQPWHLTQEPDVAPSYEELEERIEELNKELSEANKRGDAWRFRADIAEVKLAKAVELLKEARQDLEEYVTHEWPKDEHPVYERKWERDMELCRRIDATLAEIEGSNAP
jgi:predicted  nucleic acid-binding Zn-ribbon protein